MGTGEAASLLGILVKTLQRCKREVRLVPATRTASDRRRYAENQLRAPQESDNAVGAPDQD